VFRRPCRFVLSILCVLGLLTQVAMASAESPVTLKMGVDNSFGSGAISGQILSSSDLGTRVSVRNLHGFWTNLRTQSLWGSAQFAPTNPLDGGQDVGGMWASIGLLPPDQTAVWIFTTTAQASEAVTASPSLAYGDRRAGFANLLTIIASMLGVVPSAGSGAQIIQAVQIAGQSVDLVGAGQSLEDQDPVGFADHFYNALSDPAQQLVIQQALSLIGVQVSTSVLKNLVLIVSIVQLAQFAADEILAIVQDTHSGEVIFNTIPLGVVPAVTTIPAPVAAPSTTSTSIPVPTVAPTATPITQAPPAPIPYPIIGKWQRVGGGNDLFDFVEFQGDANSPRCQDFQLTSCGNVTAHIQSDSVTGKYFTFEGQDSTGKTRPDDHRLHMEFQSQGSGTAYILRFSITGDHLTISNAPFPGSFAEPSPGPTYEYQRVSDNQPLVQAGVSPSQATVAAQTTQIAALQTAVARSSRSAPRPSAATVPTTPAAAARQFFEAVITGDIDHALSLMSASGRSTYAPLVRGLAQALGQCNQGTTEVAPYANGQFAATFTPPCGDFQIYWQAMKQTFPEIGNVTYPNRRIAACSLVVQSVNEEWKVTSITSCG
jgi:hypothetical protein